MDEKTTIQLQGDENGAMKLSCPFCEEQFKIYISDWKEFEDDKLTCALCGLSAEFKKFLPKEVYEAVEQAVYERAEQMIYDAFKGFKSSKFLKVKLPKPKTTLPKDIKTYNTTDAVYCCRVCNKEYRIPNFSENQKTYCPFCGKLI